MHKFTITGLLLAIFFSSFEAKAQTHEDQAYELFERAESLYAEGELEEAARLLLEARELQDNPTLLYNLARCYEGLGRLEEAATAYRQYLEEAEDPPARGAIEQRIATIDGQLQDQARAEQERASEQARAEAAERRAEERAPNLGPWPWIVTGIGLSGLLGGAITGVLALNSRDEALGASDQQSAAEMFARAERLAVATTSLLAVGGVVTAVGVALAIYALVTTRRHRGSLAMMMAIAGFQR